ncbi:dual specificity protein kinase Mph1 [Schizosaccharomyces pombe]|uniref:Serine/threonine-protein kinase mph1 n=1 Tax=Schizosaccharomyces pombe (strain 972 / ATCC 24843) TaxID=284812 RepID=MPS1_SCHPO|nr:dual-specificity protein kinase Mph1 [Schizosaccharomyces pombe]O94235.1 RecName: Full=Serine/threonine-protein kinase mph1 [Schizosaccharomyces pombe 972h-]AAD01648.1 protein kinase homolog [Schizosaccharomyces pombe]CAB72266.2 dual specificity protein kinase Mph1 [Schizosaccharomyces pombe]|eukprot:NP_595150.2 dual-specificity protein kinase Mph1 [Schizosaccharomyces pombe]
MSKRNPPVTNIADLVSDSSLDEDSLSFLEELQDPELYFKNDTFSSKSSHSDGTVTGDTLRRQSSGATALERLVSHPRTKNFDLQGNGGQNSALKEVNTPAYQSMHHFEHLITPLPSTNASHSEVSLSAGVNDLNSNSEHDLLPKSVNKTPGSLSISRRRRIGRIGLGPPKRAEYTLTDPSKTSDTKNSTEADEDIEMKSREVSPASNSVAATTLKPLQLHNTPLQTSQEHPKPSFHPSQFESSFSPRVQFDHDVERRASELHSRPVTVFQEPQRSASQPYESHALSPKVAPLFDNSQATPIPKRQQDVVTVANLQFIKLGVVGKGGSSMVYRIFSPDNSRLYALKEVNFINADQTTIQGYKNEIALLRKLSGNDRIIKLYAAEVNDTLGQLNMVMECGETDLANLLMKNMKKPINLNFIRMYWEQMLEAVQVVHDQNIVHSDLKPANFLLVEGNLKLIDFGIAKAIGNDTTNIHRDSHIGTINYMAPEALTDMNAHTNSGVKLVKLGRPSDVWSLGCILYQMVYGRAPFAHLKMIQAIAAIPNEQYHIHFPEVALPANAVQEKEGSLPGVTVGPDLMDVMKRCLERDQRKRLTIPELLVHPFLNPLPSYLTPLAKKPLPVSGHTNNAHPLRLSTEISASQLSMIIERSVELSKHKRLNKELIDSMAYDCVSNLRKMPE